MTLRAHYDAIKAMIPAKFTVYSFNVPEIPTYPYVLLHGGMGQESGEALTGDMDTLTMRPKITYAGLTGESVLSVAYQVRAVMIRALPAVPGYACSRLGHSSLIDVTTDSKVTIPGTKSHPVFAVDEFPFTSQRA